MMLSVQLKGVIGNIVALGVVVYCLLSPRRRVGCSLEM